MKNNTILIAAALAMLGSEQKDKVTGFVGTVSSVSFDAFGCVHGYLTPAVSRDATAGTQKIGDSQWFDIKRLKPTGKRPMAAPNFNVALGDEPGGQAKSAPPSGPR